MSAARKTSKQALPNVPGAAMVQALGDAVFGTGNAVVEATYPVTFAGRPVTVSLSVEEVVAAYMERTSFAPPADRPQSPGASVRFMSERIATIARVNTCHPLDAVADILAARHGAAPPGDADAITSAILRLFAVAPDKGIAEDEVVRHLLALDLTSDVDAVSDRLLAMVTATTLAIVHRGKPDTRKRGPVVYARGPAFPATGGA